MPPPVKVRFEIANAAELDRVFASLERRLQKLQNMQPSANQNADKNRIKSAENAEKQATRIAEREAKARTRIEEREDQARLRSRLRMIANENREREKAAKQNQREMARLEREHARQVAKEAAGQRARAAGVAGGIGRAARSTLGTVAGVAGGLGMTGGVAAIGAALFEGISLQEQAALLVNSTRNMKTGLPSQSVDKLIAESQGYAMKYGIKASDVMAGMTTVAERAGGESGLTAMREDLDDLIKTSKAFGVSMQDTGGIVAAALKVGINPGKEMRELFTALAAMGKEGQIEMRNLSSELPQLVGIGRNFDMSPAAMARRQVGMAQIAVQSKVSPEQARTAVGDMANDLALISQKYKVSAFTKSGKERDPVQVLADVIDAAAKGSGGIARLKTDVGARFTGTSKALLNPAMQAYLEGGGAKGRGRAAVVEMFDKASAAQLAPGERDAALGTMMGTAATQMTQQTEVFKAKISELIPKFVEMLPAVTSLTAKFAEMAVWAGKNPLESIALLFTGNVIKDAVAGSIAKAASEGMTTGLGKMTLAGSIAITAAAVYLVGKSVIDTAFKEAEVGGKKTFAAYAEADFLVRKAKTQGLTPEEQERGRAALSTLQAAKTETSRAFTGTLQDVGTVAGVAASNIGRPDKFYAELATMAQATLQQLNSGMAKGPELGASIEQLSKAMKDVAASAAVAAEKMGAVGGNDLSNPGAAGRGK